MRRYCRSNLFRRWLLWLCITASAGVQVAYAQTSEYSSLIQKGNTELHADENEQALRTGQSAIQLAADRWEGYALAGGALMKLERYEEAADQLSKAIELAPDNKQSALRDLRRRCLSTGAGAAVSRPSPSQAQANVTQAEVVLWKTIESSGNPVDFQTYLASYPDGAFSPLARNRLAEIAQHNEQRLRAQNERDLKATWVDSSTSLMWTRRDNGREADYATAWTYCANLRLVGYADWRLPTYEELEGISRRRLGYARNLSDNFQPSEGTAGLWSSTSAQQRKGPNNANGMDWMAIRILTGDVRAVCVRSSTGGAKP